MKPSTFRTVIAAITLFTTLSLAQDGPDGPRVTISNEQQASKVVNGISSYIDKLTRQPAFTSVASVLATALPSSVVSSLTANAHGPLEGVLPTSGAYRASSLGRVWERAMLMLTQTQVRCRRRRGSRLSRPMSRVTSSARRAWRMRSLLRL